jgi:hypothetical protein
VATKQVNESVMCAPHATTRQRTRRDESTHRPASARCERGAHRALSIDHQRRVVVRPLQLFGP